jgi:hypothetical protein
MAEKQWLVSVDSFSADEIALAHTMPPSQFVEQVMGIQLLDWQKQVLDSIDCTGNKYPLIICPGRNNGRVMVNHLAHLMKEIYDLPHPTE